MIIWLNGTFGAGKTATAAELLPMTASARLFDPETVGYLLRQHLADLPVTDFQHWPAWRPLVVATAAELTEQTGQHLIAPQTVMHAPYWQEIHDGFTPRAALRCSTSCSALTKPCCGNAFWAATRRWTGGSLASSTIATPIVDTRGRRPGRRKRFIAPVQRRPHDRHVPGHSRRLSAGHHQSMSSLLSMPRTLSRLHWSQ